MDVPADAGFICDKTAVLGTSIKGTLLQLGIRIVFTYGLFNDAFKY
jgi:hypothetical protein